MKKILVVVISVAIILSACAAIQTPNSIDHSDGSTVTEIELTLLGLLSNVYDDSLYYLQSDDINNKCDLITIDEHETNMGSYELADPSTYKIFANQYRVYLLNVIEDSNVMRVIDLNTKVMKELTVPNEWTIKHSSALLTDDSGRLYFIASRNSKAESAVIQFDPEASLIQYAFPCHYSDSIQYVDGNNIYLACPDNEGAVEVYEVNVDSKETTLSRNINLISYGNAVYRINKENIYIYNYDSCKINVINMITGEERQFIVSEIKEALSKGSTYGIESIMFLDSYPVIVLNTADQQSYVCVVDTVNQKSIIVDLQMSNIITATAEYCFVFEEESIVRVKLDKLFEQ